MAGYSDFLRLDPFFSFDAAKYNLIQDYIDSILESNKTLKLFLDFILTNELFWSNVRFR